MEQLSGLDASFLYLETDNAPMLIGGVSILDPHTAGGTLDCDGFRRHLESRLRMSRTLTQRLVEVPLNLGRPYWIEDDDFDLDFHLERTQLPEPGGWKEVSALMAWEMSQTLPRERPLWKLVWAEGVDGIDGVPAGSVALIGKVHHAAVDGVSGGEILGALFDVHPDPPARKSLPAPTREREPGALELVARAGVHLVKTPLALPGLVGRTARSLAGAGAARAVAGVKLPPLPFSAPKTRFSAPLSKERVWHPVLFPLDRIRALKTKADATVNDIVLAICSGALRRYLVWHDELPDESLVAMVPVSVRTEDEAGTMGNQVSAMLVSLATDEPDPTRRLAAVRRGASESKIYHRAVGAKTLVDYSRFVPFSLAALAARTYTGLGLSDRHRPPFNVVITNVPGPQIPLYVNGARLLAHVGSAPIFDGVGLMLPIFSYAGNLAIGITSARELLPDIESLAGEFEASIAELEELLLD